MADCIQCGNTKLEANGLCATCNHSIRKSERMKVKEKKPIRKVSEKRGKELNQYAPMRERALNGSWCGVHGKPCIPTEIHHQKGKVGFCDEEGREKGIPALLDVRYWIPVCREAHDWITEHSKEAIEQGYSFLRSEK